MPTFRLRTENQTQLNQGASKIIEVLLEIIQLGHFIAKNLKMFFFFVLFYSFSWISLVNRAPEFLKTGKSKIKKSKIDGLDVRQLVAVMAVASGIGKCVRLCVCGAVRLTTNA